MVMKTYIIDKWILNGQVKGNVPDFVNRQFAMQQRPSSGDGVLNTSPRRCSCKNWDIYNNINKCGYHFNNNKD